MLTSYGGAIRYWTCAHSAHCYSCNKSSTAALLCTACDHLATDFSWIQVFFQLVLLVLLVILRCIFAFLLFQREVFLLFYLMDVFSTVYMPIYYSNTCYDAILPLHFSPDSRFFQLVLYCALCLSSGEWGFHPVHTTRFPHSQCRRHLRMWSV